MKKEKIPGLAENIKTLRENSGLTLEICAKKLGLSCKTSFIAYELGKAEPSLSALLKIADLFNVDVESILREKIPKVKKLIFNKCKNCGADVKSKSGRPLYSNYCNECYW